MLYLVNEERKILAKWDAWYINCEKECSEMIETEGYEIINVEITFMGNKIVTVR